MLTQLHKKLSNAGVNSQLDPSSTRYIVLTNRFGIISSMITLIILIVLLVELPERGWTITRLLVLTSSVLFSSVVLINKYQLYKLSKWVISWLPPVLILCISISDKVYQFEFITIREFFNYRFLLMATTIVPLLVFSTKDIKSMLVCLLPSFVGIVFFDNIHRPFGVSFADFGHHDPNFYLLNVMIGLSYSAFVGFILNQRFVADKFESKMLLQQGALEEKNQELRHKNSFINEQNHEITAQSDKLKEANDALVDAKKIIETQKQLLEDQNRNLENQVLEKTKDLSRVNEELIVNNNEMRQFSHTLSHNLKSPVATFQGLLNLVDEAGLNSGNKELLKYLKESVGQMQSVFADMNEMLELRNQLYTSTEEVDIQKQIDGIHNHFYLEFQRNKIDFSCKCNGIKSIHTNEKRLNGILYQLVSNAIKFRSDERKPIIQVHLNGNDEFHSLKIKDNGRGIDLERFGQKLFYPYQKFHDGIAGKGLGLYLVKLQTESLGGKVHLSSKVDEYTEVEVLIKK